MHLQLLDWLIVGLSLLICFVPALFFAKRAGSDTSEFFASGRSVPWWLAGLSMVATTFSSDTPNLVTDIVRRQGVAGNWCWWAFLLTGIATVFFYAQLWRRSGVMTDLEFYEVRYSGKAAGFVRGFRSIYLGLFYNCMIMATVNLAACKIAGILFGLERWQTLLGVGILNVAFAAHAGLWGVLVIDMIQFFIKMTAVIAAAWFAVKQVGGLDTLISRLSAQPGPNGLNYLNILPDFSNQWDLAFTVFILPVAVQWWAVWYPGSEPGGGSYMAQRMLASKSEKDALGAVLFFNVAHYVLRPWPWILVGLCSILVYPELSDIQKAFPHLDPALLGHDIAYPAMLKFLPTGFIGLMVGGLIAANSSTILTHLNWGASYLVHDFYQRFIKTDASERHYVWVGRMVTVGLFVAAALLTFFLDSAKNAFDLILQIGAGTGLLYLVRWFWWRVNAWCEVIAMASSFVVSIMLLLWNKSGHSLSSAQELLTTIAVTTVCWVSAAYLAPPTDRKTLIEFYLKVRPFGPGWRRIRLEAGVSREEARSTHQSFPLAIMGWVFGCSMVWSSLFSVGNFLYGRTGLAWALAALSAASASVVIYVTSQLWSGKISRRFSQGVALILLMGLGFSTVRSEARERSKTVVDFSGYSWRVKDGFSGPGPNYWNSSTESVWIDSDGSLHLKARYDSRSKKWTCSEVSLQKSLGCGSYEFELDAPSSKDFEDSLVAGFFLYQDDEHEYDFEISRWSESPYVRECQFVLQPWSQSEHRARFGCLGLSNARRILVRIDWTNTTTVGFSAVVLNQYGTVISAKVRNMTDPAHLIRPGKEFVAMNLWLYEGKAPADGLDREVTIRSFKFTPSSGPCAGRRRP